MSHVSKVVEALLVIALLSPTAMSAQRSPRLEYAVKLVCGTADHGAVAPGRYFTAVNVHNPGLDTTRFQFKVATTLPGLEPGPVSRFVTAALGADQALEVDCQDALRAAPQRSSFLKGFLVLQAESPLDVVGVYTAAGTTREVETLFMERVPPRQMAPAGCPDLVVVDISRPTWDSQNHRTVIEAVIKNVGTAQAPPTLARVIDPTTLQDTGAPYNSITPTPALDPMQSVTVTFFLPYWVYNPDVTLEVTADYKNEVAECQEGNNQRRFDGIG